MKNILCLEGGISQLSMALFSNGTLLDVKESEQYRSTDFFGNNIDKIIQKNIGEITRLDAMLIGSGPGSYTGLRALYSLCYGLAGSLNIPLIQIDSLDAVTQAFVHSESFDSDEIWACIDARRMEVYAKKYHANGTLMEDGHSIVFTEEVVDAINKAEKRITFIGNSNEKLEKVLDNNLILFSDFNLHAKHLYPLFRKDEGENYRLNQSTKLPFPIYFKPPNITRSKRNKL